MAKIPALKAQLGTKFDAEQIRHYLRCYLDNHHNFDPDDEQYFIVQDRNTRRQKIRKVLTCMRCGSLRYEHMGIANGARIGGLQYVYSEGYKMAKGERITPADRDAIRLFLASKAKITIVEDEGA
jgi:hypothetical protein